MFAEGMVLAMEERHAKGVPMPEVVRSELVDLARMNKGLEGGSASLKNNALVAINLFAQAVFTAASPYAATPSDFRRACLAFADEFIDLVKDTELQHQAELDTRGTRSGDTEAIDAVSQWLQDRAASEVTVAAAE